MATPKVTLSTNSAGLKIYINGLLHVCIKDITDYLGFQSWKQGKDHYCIEYYLKQKKFICSYNSFDKWSSILKLLDNID